ncbi:hypothetical protein RvY_07705-2 [Ramazzottius varieornatus]|uniref:Caprin-1 dimerization domain-containing protein n=1 Tax=Ramazzottius varieornatus TaxID=947166 RepID=A0A1D1VBH8_RAMVA|nr:hypothetical protein RvY_07705-2 [Ramazzottius varieornatus]
MAQKSDVAEVDIVEPITNSLTELKKKIRNLEKKKTKLDTLRSDVKKSGKPLNEDQAQALARYEDISQQLESFRELHKQLEVSSTDVEKAYKKFLKKQESSETDRFLALEKYRAVVRAAEPNQFIDANEAPLTEADHQSLNSLRKILFPSHSDFSSTNKFQSFDEFLKHVAEQQLNLVSGRAVQFLDEPVSQAKELLERLVGSQYFVQHSAQLFARPSQVQKSPAAVQDRSRSSTISSQHTGQTLSVTQYSVAVLQKEHGDVHSKSPVFPTTGSAPAGYPVQQSNVQTGLPVPSAGTGPASHLMISPMPSSYSVPTQPVDVMQNIDHFSPETIKNIHPRRDSQNEHSNQISKDSSAWQPVSSNGRAPVEQKALNDSSSKSYHNPGDASGSGDQRVPRQNGNRYRDDNRPGYNGGMNDGSRGRGRGGYHQNNNQDRRHYAYPGGERRPDEAAGENGRRGGDQEYRSGKERSGTSGDRFGETETRQAYGNGQDHDGSGDKSGEDTDFGVFHVDNPNYKGRTGIPGEDRRGGRRGQGFRGGPSNGNYGYGRSSYY